jgi:guanine deaminase
MTTTPGFRRVFKALVMNPLAPDRVEVYDPGYLVVADEKVERLSPEDPREEFPAAGFIDLGRQVILPGLVDTHVHLPQFAIMGIGAGELLSWLNTYTYPEEARFADPEYAAKISETFFDEMLANGTTAAVVYSSVHEQAAGIAFSAARARGLRAFIGKVMMDQNSPATLQETAADSIAASVRLFDEWDGADGGRLRYIFTPRYAASCSMDLMKSVGRIAAERGAFVQSHLSENKDEVEWVRNLFPGRASYTSIYESAGLLGERSLMAHCIHLSPEEIALLAGTKTKVAFCPYSNRTLRSGTMPYLKLRDAGLDIALGTDVAGGPSLSMLQQMGEAVTAAAITPTEALYLATLGGAGVLGLSDRIGNLDPGKDADFIVVQPNSGEKTDQILSGLCFHAGKENVAEVYLRGRRVYFKNP